VIFLKNNTFYISKSTNPKTLFYIYEQRGLLGISYTLNLKNNTIYTRDRWPEHIMLQSFIVEQGDAHLFIKTLFEHEFRKINRQEE